MSAHEAAEFIVQINDNGFIPSQIQVKQGDYVIFENKGQKEHWPASDIHPSHAIYPEFDPREPVTPGQSFRFRFEKEGKFGFHDHLYPQYTGTITVEEDPDFVATDREETKASLLDRLGLVLRRVYFRLLPSQLTASLAKIDFSQEQEDETLFYWISIIGPTKTMEELLSDSGEGSVFDCHQPAHQIGRISYNIHGPSVFAEGDASCHSGFYHGAMEAFLAQEGTKDLAADIKELCSYFKTSFGNFECLHGVGHGVMALEHYYLPKALGLCERLDSSFAVESCYGGVFMENIVAAEGLGAIPGHETKWVSSDPHFPCNAIGQSDPVQIQCYLMQTSRMLHLSNYDFQFLVDECLKASQKMQETCFISVGRDAAGQTLRDPEKILDICNKTPSNFFDLCIQGGLYVIVDFWGDKMEGQPHQLCKVLPSENKAHCYVSLATRLPGIFANEVKIREICEFSEEEYKNTCLSTSGVKP